MSSKVKIFIILSIIAVSKIGSNASKKSEKRIIYLSSEVNFNREYFEKYSITIGPRRQTLNIILNVVKDFPTDPFLEIIVRNFKETTYRPIFKYEFNACSILGKKESNNFVVAWLKNIWKYGSLPKSCPIKKGNYSWQNMKFKKFNLPNFLPAGKYQINPFTFFRQGPVRQFVANVTIGLHYK